MNLYLKTAKSTIIICCLFLLQTALYGQSNIRITIKATEITLQKALTEVEKQSKLSVAYNESQLSNKRQLTLNIVNQPLETALNTILKGTGFTYKISDKYIMIVPEKKDSGSKTTKTVKGKVVDEKGEPLIGVNVSVEGTSTGTITDMDGNFAMLAAANSVLKVSYIGYATQLVVLSEKDYYNVVMQLDNEILDEVVVTALGIKRSDKALSYNVQKLNDAQFLTVKEVSVPNALSGKIAGVTVSQGASGIGGSTKVVMRGDKSVNPDGNNNALYVLDGIPLPDLLPKRASTSNGQYGGVDEGDGISSINMEDIAEVTVLTGPSAAALYGGQAANGVVMLTSKQGGLKDGKPRITFSHYSDFYKPFILPKLQNSYGSRTGEFASWGPKLDTPADYDPADFFDTGMSFSNSVGLQFGNDKNKSYISLAAYNARGIVHNNKMDRYNVSYNGQYNITDKLTLGATFMYVNKKAQNMLSQGEYYNPIVPVYLFPRGDNIDKYKSYERYDPNRGFPVQFWPYEDQKRSLQNPYWITHRNFNINHDERVILGGSLKYTFTDWFNVSARFRTDRNTKVNEIKNYASTLALLTSGSDKGSYLLATDKSTQDYGDIIASFQKNVADWGFVINAGASFKNTKFDYTANSNKLEFGAPLATVPNKFTLNNLTPEPQYQEGKAMKSQAVFISASVDYKRKIFLDFTGRNEWTSLLANTDNKSFFYPSAGLSFIITEFFKVPEKILTFSKLRLSYAKVGNVPLSLAGITVPSYPISPGGGVSINPDLPINNLKFEKTKSFEIGLNSRFLNNKLGFDITYYNANTFDQLFKFRAPENSGYRYFYVNAGKVNNQGIEASLDADLTWGGFNYSPMVTFTYNKNKIVELVRDIPNPFTGKPMNVSHFDMGGLSSYRNYIDEGGSVGDIYVNSFVKDGNGYVYVNPNTLQMLVDNENLIYAGNTNPDCSIGFNNTLTYKGFTLSFLVDARIGGKVVSSTQGVLDSFGASEQSARARDNGGVYVNGVLMDAETYYKQVGGGSGVLSNYVYDATNVRLREASLSYRFTKPLFRNVLKDLTISVTGRNLWMIYNKAPFDPQLTSSVGTFYQGIDYFLMPSLRSFGLNIRFAL